MVMMGTRQRKQVIELDSSNSVRILARVEPLCGTSFVVKTTGQECARTIFGIDPVF